MAVHFIADTRVTPAFVRRRLLSRARYAAIIPGRPDPDPPTPVPPGPPQPGDPVPGDPGPTDPPVPPPGKPNPDLPPGQPPDAPPGGSPPFPEEDKPPLKLRGGPWGTDRALLGYLRTTSLRPPD
jgi:hypothetical protein